MLFVFFVHVVVEVLEFDRGARLPAAGCRLPAD
jgi:hypothetical protein